MNDFESKSNKNCHSQSGAVVPLVAISMILLIAVVALAVDVGFLFVGRNELQNAADAAALGATRQMGEIYKTDQSINNFSTSNVWNDAFASDKLTIIDTAQKVAFSNQAARQNIQIKDAGVQIGIWDFSSKAKDKFTPTDIAISGMKPNAVRVRAQRDSSNFGNIALFFAGVFGVDSVAVRADATAALGGVDKVSAGEVEVPIGISSVWFTTHALSEGYCGSVIKFSPTTDVDACAGWTTFEENPANASTLAKVVIDGLKDGTYKTPSLATGSQLEFINGNVTSSFEPFMELYQVKGHPVDAFYKPGDPLPKKAGDDGYTGPKPLCLSSSGGPEVCPKDETTGEYITTNQLQYPPCAGGSGNCTGADRYTHEWTTTVPVYDEYYKPLTGKADGCTPAGTIPILGFARVTIYDVGEPAYQQVGARIECEFEEFRGGGTNFGLMGTIPGLVE